MKPINPSISAIPAEAMTLAKATLFAGVLVAIAPAVVLGEPIEKKGTTPYVTHFIFKPLMSIDISGLGTATALDAVGTTQNMKGPKLLHKMSAHCTALNVAPVDEKHIDRASELGD